LAGEPLLELRDVHAGYGAYDVLRGLSLRVNPGEIVAIIGPNGAGKSTVFKTIYGFLRPRKGDVVLAGESITGRAPETMCHRGLTYVPQGRSVFPHMTVWENLELGAFVRADGAAVARDLARLATQFPVLREKRSRPAGSLSGGEQQVVELARGLMLAPRLMLIDEPSIGLAPKFVEQTFRTIAHLRNLGTTILIVEQNARRVLEIADRAYVIELGRSRLEGTGRELLDRDDVKQMYLGGSRTTS
jgi:ABC-type branched-subunit amino acid transport system ATPase component